MYKVNCIRVTHPSAGRHLVQAPMLPLDLHVLSLPLAFILSQDQTLHRYNLCNNNHKLRNLLREHALNNLNALFNIYNLVS